MFQALKNSFTALVRRYNSRMSIKWVLLFQRLDAIERKIAMNQAELATALQAAAAAATEQAAKVAKISTETASLLAAVDALQAAVDAGGGTSPEVDAALVTLNTASTALSVALQGVDDQVPDAPAPP